LRTGHEENVIAKVDYFDVETENLNAASYLLKRFKTLRLAHI